MEHVMELVTRRKSVRSFDGTPLRAEDRKALEDCLADMETPFGIPMEFRVLNAQEHKLTSPVVTGTDLYVAGKLRRVPMAEVAFGYAFERFVLCAEALGVGTVWIAGPWTGPPSSGRWSWRRMR